MKWKIPSINLASIGIYAAGVGILAAGIFGTGVYFSGEVKQTYNNLQRSISCFYSPEDCQSKFDDTKISAPFEEKMSKEIGEMKEEIMVLKEKSLNTNPQKVDEFFQQYEASRYDESSAGLVHITVPLDALMEKLKNNPLVYQSLTKYIADQIIKEGKKELNYQVDNTRKSIDDAIDSSKNLIEEKSEAYRKQLEDVINQEGGK